MCNFFAHGLVWSKIKENDHTGNDKPLTENLLGRRGRNPLPRRMAARCPLGEKKPDLTQYTTVRAVFYHVLKQPKPTRAIFTQDPLIRRILVLCQNQHYIIAISELWNGALQYACWYKPKTLLEESSLIVIGGSTQVSPKKDKTEYHFKHNGWCFSLEKIVPPGTHAVPLIFLEVTDQEQKKSTWKMEEMPLPKYLGNFL